MTTQNTSLSTPARASCRCAPTAGRGSFRRAARSGFPPESRTAIALAEDHALGSDDRADLYRVVLRRLTPTPDQQHHLPAPADPRLRDVAALLADDPADRRTLAELGRAAGASERTLSRLFRRDTGMTFPQWRAQLRLQHAILLLAADSTVTGAAAASGYTNTSAFIAAFRDAFAVTPAAYRDEMIARD